MVKFIFPFLVTFILSFLLYGLIFNIGSFYCVFLSRCTVKVATEQKARATYEKLIDLCGDDPDVIDPLRFLRQREVVHFQRFGEALRGVQDKLAEKKYYMNDMNCMMKNNMR